MRAALAAMLVALLMLACGGQPPPPSNEPGPSSPAGSPAASTASQTGAPDVPGPSSAPAPPGEEADDLVEADAQPLLPGLYLPAGLVARGTDHYAFVQSPTDCDTLVDILAAGEWQVRERGTPVVPTPAPSSGVPPLPQIEYLLLSSGSEAAYARLGGDESGCVAQVWRLPQVAYSTAGAAFNSSGTAEQLQFMCAGGGGEAIFVAIDVAADGFVLTLSTRVPLVVGSHPIDPDTDISMGQTPADLDEIFREVIVPSLGDDAAPPTGFAEYRPADDDAGWQGSLEVSSIEPLIGHMHLEDFVDEAGRQQQSLDVDLRCDLPPGQLTRAAATPAPGDSPAPSASPTAPSSLTVSLASGPHAGTFEAEASEIDCSYNVLGKDEYWITYAPSGEPPAGGLSSVSLTVPQGGGKSDAFITFNGDDYRNDYLDTDAAQASVSDDGSSAVFEISGRSQGTDFQVSVSCGSVDRF